MDFIGKFIKVIHYNFDLNRYNKITYGFVKSDIIVEDPKNDMLLVGKFCSKPINEFGKFEEGGSFSETCYISKQNDCYREVKKDECDQFKNDLINEIKQYEQNNIKK